MNSSQLRSMIFLFTHSPVCNNPVVVPSEFSLCYRSWSSFASLSLLFFCGSDTSISVVIPFACVVDLCKYYEYVFVKIVYWLLLVYCLRKTDKIQTFLYFEQLVHQLVLSSYYKRQSVNVHQSLQELVPTNASR